MIITICGSSTFAAEMGKAADYLKNKGHAVHTPEPLVSEEWYRQHHGQEDFLKMKPIWIKNHFKKIADSEAVLILNKDKKGIAGYFGSNTLMEIAVALFLQKKIFILNAISRDHPHYEEFSAFEAIVLRGDLDNL